MWGVLGVQTIASRIWVGRSEKGRDVGVVQTALPSPVLLAVG